MLTPRLLARASFADPIAAVCNMTRTVRDGDDGGGQIPFEPGFGVPFGLSYRHLDTFTIATLKTEQGVNLGTASQPERVIVCKFERDQFKGDQFKG